MNDVFPHDWFTDRIAAAAVDGLDAHERSLFDAHLAACTQCADELAAYREMDDLVSNAVVDRRADANLEGRVIAAFQKQHRWRISPAITRAAASVAAVLAVGTVGYIGTRIMERVNAPSSIASGDVSESFRQLLMGLDNPPEHFTNPSSASEKWNFGGGAAPSQSWTNISAATSRSPSPAAQVVEATEKDMLKAAAVAEDDVRKSLTEEDRRKRDTVKVLTNTSRKYLEQGKYTEALGVVDQIKVIDPSNDYVAGVRPLIEDRALITEQRNYRESFDRNATKVLTNADSKRIPYNDILRYPANWPDLSTSQAGKKRATEQDSGFTDNNLAGEKQDNAHGLSAGRDEAEKSNQSVGARDKDAYAFGDTGVERSASAFKYSSSKTAGDGSSAIAATEADAPATNSSGASQPAAAPKIIHNAQFDYEIDSFDVASAKLSTLVGEEKGYIATTSSEKLANGKVKGIVVVRVPPERIEALSAKLRGIGELKRQNLSADDVTKQFTDVESELRAAHAMQERLLDIIKNAKGEIKDLLAAEKELAVWRGKIEVAQGQINYYNNLISMATLTISLTEKDIAIAATIVQSETIDVSVESTDVSTARERVAKAVEAAGGQVVDNQLQQQQAGQTSATLVIDVPSDKSASIITLCQSLGRVARLNAQQQSSATNTGTAPPTTQATPRVEKRNTRITLAIYNVAAMAPRTVTTLRLASDDVEATYRHTLEAAKALNARVVISNLNTANAEQTNATLRIEAAADTASDLLEKLSHGDEKFPIAVVQNDTSTQGEEGSTTPTKRGFEITLQSLAAIPPRTTSTVTVESKDVEPAVERIRAAAIAAGGRVVDQSIAHFPGEQTAANITVDVPADRAGTVVELIKSSGTIKATQMTQAVATVNGATGLADRSRLHVQLATPASIVEPQNGFFPSLRRGVATSLAGLMWSLQLLVIGLCLLVPWMAAGYGGWRAVKWFLAKRRRPAVANPSVGG